MTENDNSFNLDKVLKRIQALLAKANHPNTPEPEAETYRDKAEEMMVSYRVAEQQLRDLGLAPSMQPTVSVVILTPYRSPFRNTYLEMGTTAVYHVGARAVQKRTTDAETGEMMSALEIVGFESDVRYAELLFTAAAIVFGSKMEPKVDHSLTDGENVYNLRESGMARGRIGELMGWGREAAQKVTVVYKREAAARGEKAEVVGKGFNLKDFRAMYTDNFLSTFQSRLYRMSLHSGEQGALVLKSRKSEIDEAFYQRYPHLRPSEATTVDVYIEPEPETAAERRSREAWERKYWAAKDKQRNSAAGRAGRAAGIRAAESVDLGGSGAPRRRVDGS